MNDKTTTEAAMQGWQCPQCGAVYSPFTPKCESCGPRTVTLGGTHPPRDQCPYCYQPYHLCRGHNICMSSVSGSGGSTP